MMKDLAFNKKIKAAQPYHREPSVIFRELTTLASGNKRYQASINSSGVALINTINGKFSELQIEFSDVHSFVGLKPSTSRDKMINTFGATGIFSELDLQVGKHYKLSVINSGYAVFDSNEHKPQPIGKE